MKIKFLKDAWVSGELFAKKGDVKDIDNKLGSADRWLKRGHVEYVEEEVKVVEEEPQLDEDECLELDKMKKKELLEHAASIGVEIPKELKKVDEIRDFLKDLDIEDAL